MKLKKITKASKGARRRYDDACGAAHALDLIGERWALLVMRELLLGPRRFGDLRASLPGISANVLTQRLQGLEEAGIVLRRRLPPPASAQVYELTEWGYESEPIFQTLGRWATRSPLHDPSLPLSAASLFTSFRTMIDRRRAGTLRARIGFRFGAEEFLATLAGGRIEIVRGGDLGGANAIVSGSAPAVAAAIYGGVPLARLIADEALSVTGDRTLLETFITLFPLPAKVGASAATH